MLFIGFRTNKADKDTSILALHTPRDAISTKAKPKSLIELLATHRLALVIDLRDKIYAVASLAADCRSPIAFVACRLCTIHLACILTDLEIPSRDVGQPRLSRAFRNPARSSLFIETSQLGT
jgi:hypothetical protein